MESTLFSRCLSKTNDKTRDYNDHETLHNEKVNRTNEKKYKNKNRQTNKTDILTYELIPNT